MAGPSDFFLTGSIPNAALLLALIAACEEVILQLLAGLKILWVKIQLIP